MSLSVAIDHKFGGFDLAVKFTAHGRLTAIFGASGSGKTSIVNAIAGLIEPEHGRIAVDGQVLFDSEAGTSLPPHRRGIGYVFQDSRLFPHLSVRQNLGFGRWFTPRAQRHAELGPIAELLGLGQLLNRRPQQLSGGEKQRVALGRALLASPRLLLMDEPMASLDDARKAEILPYIERLRDGLNLPIVYVSHSIAEVARLATDIVVIAAGKVAAAGEAGDILQRLELLPPDQRREAGSLIEMTVVSHDPQFDMTRLASAAGEAYLPGKAGNPGDGIRVRIRAHDVIVATAEPRGLSALNIFRGVIAAIHQAGPTSLSIRIDCHGAEILAAVTRKSGATLGLAEGLAVHVIVKALSVEAAGAANR
ncbi:MAG: molybdenum ABC transporter ATP-binding protein [Rhizobiales bacterium]|nr:molybdenum ABC transporter ATP-binding protein [Hyphomicrobiales bacterium]MBI3672855.1 molybdenum ABC transporter ATP-binding protein [Hyphomicrobiales bacterium]